MNTQPRGKLYREDSMEIFVSTEPRQEDPGYGPFDHQFFVTPASGEGGPVVGCVADREAGKVVDVEGVIQHIAETDKGWLAQIGLPWRVFPGFSPAPGATLALKLRVNDADTSHARWKIDPVDIGFVYTEDPPLLVHTHVGRVSEVASVLADCSLWLGADPVVRSMLRTITAVHNGTPPLGEPMEESSGCHDQ